MKKLAVCLAIFGSVIGFVFGTVNAAAPDSAKQNVEDFSAEMLQSGCAPFLSEVSNSAELNDAFACYAALPARSYVISLTEDISLTAPLEPITNTRGAELTISGNGYVIDGNSSHRIMTVLSSEVTFDNITLQNGRDNSTDCFFFSSCGAALRIESDASVTLLDSTLSGNTADTGGAVFSVGNLTIHNSVFSANAGELGGAIYNNFGTLTVSGSVFSLNQTTDDGGGIYTRGVATFSNSTFRENSTQRSAGGLYIAAGMATVTNCTFHGNFAGELGGGIGNEATLTVTDSTLYDNAAGEDGGGIYNGETITLTNSTVSTNSAVEQGGGLWNFGGDMMVIHSTITLNEAPFAAGIYSTDLGNDGTTTLSASIVAGNVVSPALSSNAELQVGSGDANSFVSVGQNIVGSLGAEVALDATDLTGQAAPNLGPLGDNGCATTHVTLSGYACVQTHALLMGSIAIEGAGSATSVDQRGFPVAGSSRDVGAFEANSMLPTAIGLDTVSGETVNNFGWFIGLLLLVTATVTAKRRHTATAPQSRS